MNNRSLFHVIHLFNKKFTFSPILPICYTSTHSFLYILTCSLTCYIEYLSFTHSVCHSLTVISLTTPHLSPSHTLSCPLPPPTSGSHRQGPEQHQGGDSEGDRQASGPDEWGPEQHATHQDVLVGRLILQEDLRCVVLASKENVTVIDYFVWVGFSLHPVFSLFCILFSPFFYYGKTHLQDLMHFYL